MRNLYIDRKVSFLQASLLLIASVFIIFIRYPSFLLEPRIYAEEYLYYETFLNSQVWWEGFDALIYPSYYILSTRMAAFTAAQFDPSLAPLIMTLYGLIILALPLTIIFFTNCKYWESLRSKIILASFIIFSLSTGEIWLNSTATGFIFPVAAFLILIDDSIQNKLKTCYYSVILIFGILSGPITLLMSPFFLIRFLVRKDSTALLFCGIFLVFGLLQVTFFLISSEMGVINLNRGNNIDLSFFERFYFWFSPNFIFPVFGYFASLIFRMMSIGINSEQEMIVLLSQLNLMLPSYLFTYVQSIFLSLTKINILINVLIFSAVATLISWEFKRSNFDERVYFIILFLYLSFVMSAMSLAGHGGFRYSLVTGFILLTFMYQRFMKLKKGLNRSVFSILITSSIIIGVIEYYPRVISFTPDRLFASNEKWPVWSEELRKWEIDSSYKPKIWPYLKEKDGIWPERTAIYSINMNTQESWTNEGKFKFSNELSKKIYHQEASED